MHFVDESLIRVEAGKGGDGAVAFRREKFVPFGGPAGGDGGRGGSVILVADPGLSTLYDLRREPVYRAKSGENGGGRDCYGAKGADLVLRVPLGTIVIEVPSGRRLGDLTQPGQELCVARGGKGGRGNKHFATPTDRAPRHAEPGEPGQARDLQLELKVLADVGMLGFPNVGKSTFVRAISRARPRVADYPFTTLEPHLGVVSSHHDSARNFVVADLPGLIAGASEGVGLGTRFLRHVERTRLLVHFVTVTEEPGRNPVEDYLTVRRELTQFSSALAQRGEIVALSRADLPEVQEAYPALKEEFRERFGVDLLLVSSATRLGVERLIDTIVEKLPARTDWEPIA